MTLDCRSRVVNRPHVCLYVIPVGVGVVNPHYGRCVLSRLVESEISRSGV
jgi:hypothetical protein